MKNAKIKNSIIDSPLTSNQKFSQIEFIIGQSDFTLIILLLNV